MRSLRRRRIQQLAQKIHAVHSLCLTPLISIIMVDGSCDCAQDDGGGNFADAFKQNIKSSAVNQLASAGANMIGDSASSGAMSGGQGGGNSFLYGQGGLLHVLAHATLGCASAVAQAQVLLSIKTAMENSKDALATNQQYLLGCCNVFNVAHDIFLASIFISKRARNIEADRLERRSLHFFGVLHAENTLSNDLSNTNTNTNTNANTNTRPTRAIHATGQCSSIRWDAWRGT